MNELYKKQVALLIRIMPLVYGIQDFAVHGGTAINLFHRDMPRYSVDIDITYIPIQERDKSLKTINAHLVELKQMIEKTIPDIRVIHKSDIWKLLCVKDGLIFCLVSSDKPILESLQPNPVDQSEVLKNQFEGMTDVPFSYEDYEITRQELIEKINNELTEDDKKFPLSFEQGEPDWDKCCAGDLSVYPSVKWKLKNILKLKNINPEKYVVGVEKLREFQLISGVN